MGDTVGEGGTTVLASFDEVVGWVNLALFCDTVWVCS